MTAFPSLPPLEKLALTKKIGQVCCFGWQGATDEESRTLNAQAREIVAEMGVGAVVLLGRNVNSAAPEETRRLLADLQSLAPIPLFLAIDQEGGTVNRFRAPFHEFPGNRAIGAIAEDAGGYAYRQAETQAKELLAVGVNWNFAPVVDVNNNPDNPIIGVRAYSEDPQRVASLGVRAMHGYQNTGMLACAKHFPGHGDTSTDSHLALPTVTGDRERMNAVELVPFRALIAEGVGAIMTTHILFPALDRERPATLSPAILTGLLRHELGYDGLVITDCLEMEAIAGTIGTAAGAVQALRAGADMVLVCHTRERQRETVQAIRAAVEDGSLPLARLDDAVRRVLAAKARFLTSPALVSASPWRDPAHDALEQEIARRSITFVRNDGTLPFRLASSERLTVVSGHHAAALLVERLKGYHPNVRLVSLSPDMNTTDFATAHAAAKETDALLIATVPPEPWNIVPIDAERQARLVSELHTVCPHLVAVALREPYDLRRYPDVSNYCCTYGYRPCSLTSLADALFGIFTPTGLPVSFDQRGE